MNAGLDTSVVLRLLTGEPDTQARRALSEVQDLTRRGVTLLVSDLVAAEVYFALQYHYGVRKGEALEILGRFLRDSGVKSLGAASGVLSVPNLATSNPGFVDRLILAEYASHAREVLTFEKTAKHLTGVRVLTVSEHD